MSRLDRGIVEIFYGDGRGKTSAAIGTAARAAGHGLRVAFIQFLKGGGVTGEVSSLRRLGVEVLQLGPHGPSHLFDIQVREGKRRVISNYFRYHESDIKHSMKGLKLVERMMASGEYDLIVLDEITTALKFKHISTEHILKALKKRDKKTEVILTGFKPPAKLLKIADLVTEMKKIKHPFDKGLLARWGIDY